MARAKVPGVRAVPLAAVKALALYPEPPRTRLESWAVRPMYSCDPESPAAVRPCPWSGCRYVLRTGACAVDAAESGENTLEAIARAEGVAIKQVWKYQQRALGKLKAMGLRVFRGQLVPDEG